MASRRHKKAKYKTVELSSSKTTKQSTKVERAKYDIFMAAGVGNTKWLQQSLKLYGDGLHEQNEDGLAAIHIAAVECQLKTLKFLINERKCDVNQTSTNGWTALHLAINNTMVKKSIGCVRFLLQAGANPSSTSSSGVTPMHLAAAAGNIECMRLLLGLHATFHSIDSRGHTPQSLAVLWGHQECSRLLKHHQWLLDKKVEAMKQKTQKEEQVARKTVLEEKANNDKEEKALRAQAAYRAWLSKNNFPYIPRLLGPTLTEERIERRHMMQSASALLPETPSEEAPRMLISRAENVRSTPGLIGGVVSKSANVTRNESIDDDIRLIPLSSLAIATLKRPQLLGVQFDLTRRQLQAGRPKIIHKRGILQFPVI